MGENGQFLVVQATFQCSDSINNTYNSSFLGLNESPGTEESAKCPIFAIGPLHIGHFQNPLVFERKNFELRGSSSLSRAYTALHCCH